MQPRHPSESEIFEAALEYKSPDERAAYLDKVCAGRPELLRRVEGLLAAHDRAGDFLENGSPAPTINLTLPEEEKEGDRIGRYKVLQKIGEGGCGAVYMAEQEEPVRRRVALKVVKLGMDTKQVIARFEAERQALAMMDHPNIAKVLDAGATEKGRPYFVMELVRGIKITDYCDQNHLPTEERLKLFTQVCQAVQHAHQKGIIHRDIKPSNVLVTLHDGVPVPKIIDFGIAKATNNQRLTDKTLFTAFEQFIGTPAYMSPEQAEMSGLDIDTRSDIYSLGVLLYELLTGKTPFDPNTLFKAGLDQMRRIIREQEPPRPSTCLSTLTNVDLTALATKRHTEAPKLLNLIRGDLDWIVMKCLEKDRTRRYETANGLASEIQRHLQNEPITARPPSQLYRLQKMVRRNKVGFATATAVVAALIIGLGLFAWKYREAETARKGESEQRRKTESALAQAEANFLLAREAIQKGVVAPSLSPSGENGFGTFDPFLNLYKSALSNQPGDTQLLDEYAGLVLANSFASQSNTAKIKIKIARLDEAIARMEEAQDRHALNKDEHYLLALLYKERIDKSPEWGKTLKENEDVSHHYSDLPPVLVPLRQRALVLIRELLESNPEDYRFQSLMVLDPQQYDNMLLTTARNYLEISRKTWTNALIDAVDPVTKLVEVLDQQEKYAEIDRLFAEFLTPDTQTKPEAIALLRLRGTLHIEQGRYKDAAEDYNEAIHAAPDNVWNWFLLGVVQADSDDSYAYEKYRHDALEHFMAGTNSLGPQSAQWLTIACALKPFRAGQEYTKDDIGITNLLDKAAAEAVDLVLSNNISPLTVLWCQFAKGLAEYRLGRFDNAVQFMSHIVTLRDPADGDQEAKFGYYGASLQTHVYSVLAMAESRLNRTNEAQTSLFNAITAAALLPTVNGVKSSDLGTLSSDVICANLLMNEAKKLIGLQEWQQGGQSKK